MIEIHASGTPLEWLVTIIVGSFIWGFAWGAGRSFYEWSVGRWQRR